MSIKLYGATYSTCTQRVLLVLETLGLQYELASINMMKGEHKDPAYMQEFHPFGRIPALQDGSDRIFESKAICRYLVAKYAADNSELSLPKEAREVGAFEQAASVEFSYFDPIVTKLAYEKLFKKMMGHGEPDAATVASLENNLMECLDYYEKILASQDFVAGKHATLIDLFHVPWLAFLLRIGLQDEISSRENVKAWWKRLQDRPAWQKIVEQAAH